MRNDEAGGGEPVQPEDRTSLGSIAPERASRLEPIQIPQVELPKGGGALRSIDEKFGVNPSNGTASLDLPLPLTPNRNDFTPALALSYSSGAGNGQFGLGWMGEPAAIQRKTDKAIPRYLDPPDEDVFMISGAEDLVPVLVEHGPGDWRPSDVTHNGYRVRAYRPRIAGDFSRIERISHQAHGDYWKVVDRSNRATIYGRSAKARISDPGNSLRVFKWLPEFAYDNQGNWVAYEYKAEDGSGIPDTSPERNRRNGLARFTNLYLKRVRYGNHVAYYPDAASPFDPPQPVDGAHHFELVLDYGEHDELAPEPGETPGRAWSYRADAFSTYRSGFEIRTARLCRRILMFHHFPGEDLGADALVRSLDLTHAPVTVDGLAQASALQLVSAEQAGYVRRADGTYSRKALPPIDFTYQPIEWNTQAESASPDALADAPAGLSPPYRFVDLFGEGIAGIFCEAGESWIYKFNRTSDRSRDVSFSPGRLIAPRPAPTGINAGTLTLDDVAASGEKQLVVNAPQLAGYYALRDDFSWEPFRPFRSAANVDLRDPSVRRIDLTGDGTLEIVVAEDQAFTWYRSMGKDGFAPAERILHALDEERAPGVVFEEAEQSIFLADMSGDGLTDIVRIRNGEIAYWPNLGHGRFGAKVAMSDSPWFDLPDLFDPSKLHLADITGTGAADVIYAGTPLRAWLNQAGNGWSGPTAFDGIPGSSPEETIDVADLRGGGTACIIWSSTLPGASPAPLRFLDLMGGRKPHLLTAYSNNLGKTVSLDYRSSTQFYLDDVAAGAPWTTRLPFPVHVVARQVVKVGVTGARLTSAYTYHHGFWDPDEREFRGFGRVDRTDSEDFEDWVLSGGSASEARDTFQPPVLVRTWYHLGGWDREGRILNQFEREYWQPSFERAFPSAPAPPSEPRLADARLVAAPSVADPNLMEGLSAVEWREAMRACKGIVLRQEVFALDAPASGATPADRQRQLIPFTVDTHSCHIQLLQPRGPNPHAVFVVAEDEALSISLERQPADPRISHSLNLRIDELGNVLESASVAYGRDPVAAAAAADSIAAAAGGFVGLEDGPRTKAALADALARAEAVQSRTLVTVSRSSFTGDIDTPETWRARLPAETETFEVTGLIPAPGTLLTRTQLENILVDPNSSEIAFEDEAGAGVVRRPVEHSRTIYYDEAAAAPLPLGSVASHGLVVEGQTRAYTPSLLTALFGARIAAPAALLPAGGYVHSGGDTDWWVPTGTMILTGPGETIADVRGRFFRPIAYSDPFGARTAVRYHKDYFLLIEETEDSAGNVRRSEDFDFRRLTPTLVRDTNDNLSAIVLDELELVKASAILGKDLDSDGAADLELADDLGGIQPDSTNEVATVAALLAAADSSVIEPLARQLLNHASVRFVYDLDAWRLRGTPAVAVTIGRERHHADDPQSPLQLGYEYSDGSGSVAMRKSQAEPGPARKATVASDGTVTVVEIDSSLQVPKRLRWVGTGRLILNNKGNPVRRYEPYFSVTPHYEDIAELVATGVSATLTYDALGRLVRTDRADGTIVRSEFDCWTQRRFDAGDNVLECRWYRERKDRLIDSELLARGADPAREAEAAIQAAAFAGTPLTLVLDPLARPVLSVDHCGPDGAGDALLFATAILLDVEGNVLELHDARGNRPMVYSYDMLGRRAVQRSMDAGSRWILQTVTGNPLRRWDERGHVLAFSYDSLQRPTGLDVSGGDGPAPLANRVMHAVYGEGQPNDRRRGLRGKMFRQWDTAGLQQWTRFDKADNLIESERRFARDYRSTVDWSGDLELPLEAETHVSKQHYDALKRVTESTFPDGSLVGRRYNEAGLIERIDATAAGGAVQQVLSAADYDERGRRVRTLHGNGAISTFAYDPESRRLIRLRTLKADGTSAQDLSYTHDCAGNLTHLKDDAIPAVFFDNSKVQALSRFAYDPLYRLVSSEGREHSGQQGGGFGPEDNWGDRRAMAAYQPGDSMAWRAYSQSYRFDAVGNLRTLAHSAGSGSYTRDFTYEAATNRLSASQIGADLYAYHYHPSHGFIDVMPHLTAMTFNFHDEIAALSRQSVSSGTPETHYYVYDNKGRRVRKVTDHAAAGGAPAIKGERLYLGAFEIYRSYSGATAGLERTTLGIADDEAGRVALIDRRNGIDDGTPGEVTRFQLSNHLGSSVMELDSNCRTLAYEEFHPFGTTAYQATDSSLEVAARRYRYCGMERDEESGLALHGVRYYCPWLARWTKPDPTGVADGPNDYLYAGANPLALKDSSGANCDPTRQSCPGAAITTPAEDAAQQCFAQPATPCFDGSTLGSSAGSSNPATASNDNGAAEVSLAVSGTQYVVSRLARPVDTAGKPLSGTYYLWSGQINKDAAKAAIAQNQSGWLMSQTPQGVAAANDFATALRTEAAVQFPGQAFTDQELFAMAGTSLRLPTSQMNAIWGPPSAEVATNAVIGGLPVQGNLVTPAPPGSFQFEVENPAVLKAGIGMGGVQIGAGALNIYSGTQQSDPVLKSLGIGGGSLQVAGGVTWIVGAAKVSAPVMKAGSTLSVVGTVVTAPIVAVDAYKDLSSGDDYREAKGTLKAVGIVFPPAGFIAAEQELFVEPAAKTFVETATHDIAQMLGVPESWMY